MSHFCTKCGNNWARLHSIEDEVNDEAYEFCPVCRTDAFLTETVNGPAFIMNMHGQIIDITSGKEVTKEVAQPLPAITTIGKSYSQLEAEREMREDKALEEYHKMFENNLTEAKRAYTQILSNK